MEPTLQETNCSIKFNPRYLVSRNKHLQISKWRERQGANERSKQINERRKRKDLVHNKQFTDTQWLPQGTASAALWTVTGGDKECSSFLEVSGRQIEWCKITEDWFI